MNNRADSPSPLRHHDQFLDTPGAAELLGLSESYLRQLRVAGHGPTFSKLSAKAVRYRVADLLDWATSKSVTSTSNTG